LGEVAGGIAIRQLALAVDEKGIGMVAHGAFEGVEQSRGMIHGDAIVNIGPITLHSVCDEPSGVQAHLIVLSASISSIIGSPSDAV
jgi:hypothetical protein